ncbi:hypothetical protein ACET3Z_023159 [Daucus carota]
MKSRKHGPKIEKLYGRSPFTPIDVNNMTHLCRKSPPGASNCNMSAKSNITFQLPPTQVHKRNNSQANDLRSEMCYIMEDFHNADNECNNKTSKSQAPTSSLCCKNRNVKLPKEPQPPEPLASLLTGFHLHIPLQNLKKPKKGAEHDDVDACEPNHRETVSHKEYYSYKIMILASEEASKIIFSPTKVECLNGVHIKMVALGCDHSVAVTVAIPF